MAARDLLAILRRGAPSARELEALIADLAKAREAGVREPADEALRKLAGALSRLKAMAELAGRLSLIRPAYARESFAARRGEPPPEVIPVEFTEAIMDLMEREPMVARHLSAAAATVEAAYGPVILADAGDWAPGVEVYPHGFALAKSIDLAVTERVREAVIRGVREGDREAAVREVTEIGGWSRGYAETVVRTNTTTAYTAGRFREARSIAEAGIRVAFEFSATLDSDLRDGKDSPENHKAMNEIKAAHDDPVWDRFSPPLGFNCRCILMPYFGDDLTPNALYTALGRGAKAAPGFGSRPDRQGLG